MFRRSTFTIGLMVLALSWLADIPARAQDANAADETEPIVFEPALEFWEIVERVVRSADLELHWTRRATINTAAGEREKAVSQGLAMVAKLKKVSLPNTGGYKRIRQYGMSHYPQFTQLGFLVREEPDAWTVFTSDWRVETTKKERHTRIETSDVNREIDAGLEIARLVQGNRDPKRRWIEEPAELKDDSHGRLNQPPLLFDVAYLAFTSGRKEAVEPLIRAAFYEHAEFLDGLYNVLAWRAFESATLDLNQGAARLGLSRRFQRIATEFPGGKYEQQATEYARTLGTMAVEDAEWKQAGPLAQLSSAERVKALVFQLRDCNAVQWSQPGQCWIPSVFQPVETENATPNAADQLIQEGFDAVPDLIAALEDTRLTRGYGYWRDFSPWRYVFQIRDAAIQALVVIADEQLYHNNTSSGYFSNDTEEVRAAAIKRVKEWWNNAQAMGESQWLRSRLSNASQSRALLLRRLVLIDKEKAAPDVRKWLAEEKYSRVYAYQLLLRAGGGDALPEVQAAANPRSTEFDFAAISALNREQRIVRADYVDALLRGAETIAKRDSGKLPGQVLAALTETGDRKCSLFVADRLRGGRTSYDRSMGWALSNIKDPAIGAEVVAYLLPMFDDVNVAVESGYRRHYMEKPDLYRVKDNAAFTVNRLLGNPLSNFSDLTPPERDAEIEKLRKICAEREIRPAFSLPGM